MSVRAEDRCPATWGLRVRCQCLQKAGHDGPHSGIVNGDYIVWGMR